MIEGQKFKKKTSTNSPERDYLLGNLNYINGELKKFKDYIKNLNKQKTTIQKILRVIN